MLNKKNLLFLTIIIYSHIFAITIKNTGAEDLYITFNNQKSGAEMYTIKTNPGSKENPAITPITHTFKDSVFDMTFFYRVLIRVSNLYSVENNPKCVITASPITCSFWEIWCVETKPAIEFNSYCGTPFLE